jgi:hypothetical protein
MPCSERPRVQDVRSRTYEEDYADAIARQGLKSERPGGPGEGTSETEPLPASEVSRREGVTPQQAAGPDNPVAESVVDV